MYIYASISCLQLTLIPRLPSESLLIFAMPPAPNVEPDGYYPPPIILTPPSFHDTLEEFLAVRAVSALDFHAQSISLRRLTYDLYRPMSRVMLG